MAEKASPFSDLSFFKFQAPNAEVWANAGWLFLLLVLTVGATVLVYRRVQAWRLRRGHDRVSERLTAELRFPKHLRQMLILLASRSGHADPNELIGNAWAFEHAVEEYYRHDFAADQEAVAELRGHLHLNVTNPHLKTESTRQLLPDLPVRLLVRVGEHTLDLHCYLVDVNESFLLIHVPADKEIHALLQSDPRVRLIFWREHEGESMFRTRLTFVPSEGLALAHAEHALRSEQAAQRADFRLTVDFPVSWRFVDREKLADVKAGHETGLRRGEGRLRNLGYHGAAFEAHEGLAPHGLVQLQFSIDEKPLHLVLEVTAVSRRPEGRYLHHGRTRGMSHEVKTRIFEFISREQLANLREQGVLHPSSGGSA